MKRILSIIIISTILLFSLWIPSASATSAAVSAVPINNYTVKRTGLIGGSVFPLYGYNLSGEIADRLLPWDVSAETLSLAHTAHLSFTSMSQPLCGSTGFMFYISVPAENTVAFVLELEKPDDTSRWSRSYAPELSPYVGEEYMLLRDGASAWESGSFVSTYPGSSYKAGIHFESGFSGFVKVPYSSFRNDSGFKFDAELDVLNIIPFRFAKVGGDYGAVTVAPLLLVTNDGDEPAVVLPEEYKKSTPVNAYAFSSYKIGTGDISKNDVCLPNNETITAAELYSTSAAPNKKILWYNTMSEPLDGTDGIVLYLSLPSANKITVDFTLKDPGDKSRWNISTYLPQMLLYSGMDYYVLPDNSNKWETRTVINAANGSQWRGNMSFNSAFSGYIIIPYTSLKNDSGFKLIPEEDIMDGFTITLSEMNSTYGKVTAWGGLKPEGSFENTSSVSVYKRVPIKCSDTANGNITLSREAAAFGEQVTVTVSPDSGYRLAADGLKAVYTDIMGEKQALIVNKGDTETKGKGSGNSFNFTMPNAEEVTVTAEYTSYGSVAPALLDPIAVGRNSIRFGMRLYDYTDNITYTGFLLTDKKNDNLSHSGNTDGVVDIPCTEKADETSPDDNRYKYTDYTLRLDGIIDAETEYTVRGYAVYYNGETFEYHYTNTVTVSLEGLKETLFPEMKSFGEISEVNSVYCSVSTVETPISKLVNANAMKIWATTEQQCDISKTQDSKYWSSVSYAPFSLDGITDIMFYVKVPENNNNLYVVFEDSSGNSYKLWGDRTYMTLNKSDSTWNEKKTEEGKDRTQGLIELSAGFEGYVRIPLTSLYIASKLNGNSYLKKVTYRFAYIGDESAPITVGPMFGLYGEARKPVKPIALADLPDKTTNAKVYTDKNEIFSTSGIFYWQETDNAESYLITAYKKDCGYIEVSSYRVYSNSGAIIGLAANTDYTVQITACDSKEKAISYYAPFEITTASSDAPTVSENADNSFSAPVVSSNSASLSYKTLSAGNSALLDGNPNRGLRGCMEFYHFNLTDDALYKKLNGYLNSSKFTTVSSPIYVCYIYPGDYLGGMLDSTFFATLQKIFDFCREKQIQLLLRFAYYDVNNFNDRTPTTEEIVSHIDQIAANGIISRNTDVLHTFQAGFIGYFGEWHSDNPRADRSQVLTAFAEKLLPDGVYSQLRMQNYKQYIPPSVDRKRFGIHLDSYFGIMDGSELGSGSFSYGNAEWDECVAEAKYAPNDAELYYWDQFNSMNLYCEGYAAAIGAKQLCLTTLSGINGYFDSGIYSESCMSQWKKLPVTAEWLKFNSLPYSDGWFKASDGSAVSRNVFEYIRDYLGYRISVKNLNSSVSESSIDISLELENHGLSAAFNTESFLCLIDSNGNIVNQTKTGNPSEWYTGSFTLSANLDAPVNSGEYSVALKITSKSGANARLDNDIPFKNGYNILYKFTKE